jgi:hypothetical protein
LRLLVSWFFSLLPKELVPQVTLELGHFLEVIGLWRKHGRIWGCVQSVPKWVWLRSIGIFVEGLWWSYDITNLLLLLTIALPNIIRPKRLPIIVLVCLNHYHKLRFTTRQPTHHLPQLIILILQSINKIQK